MDNPNHKGNVAELAIATAAAKLGIPVYGPMVEHARYDLVLEIAGQLRRVQCKWGRLDSARNVVIVRIASSRLTSRGKVITKYRPGEVDLLGVYSGELDRCYLLPESLFVDRKEVWLRLEPARNGQRSCINLAAKYEFEGAVAQLVERRAGSAQATGSSPVSSTSQSPGQVGCDEFRIRLGHYVDLALAGHEILVSRRGGPRLKFALAK